MDCSDREGWWSGPGVLQQLVVRERTLGPSCPQNPTGVLSAWSGWSCDQSTLLGTRAKKHGGYKEGAPHRTAGGLEAAKSCAPEPRETEPQTLKLKPESQNSKHSASVLRV
jgi:hypothetical protein